MALYRVMVPFSDESGAAGVRYTTIEVEAESETEARRLALVEFTEMSVLRASGQKPRAIERDIRIERAPVSRRSTLEIATTAMGTATVARLVGSVNSTNFVQFQQILDDIKGRGVERLVLDLSGLTYINSTGLSLFVAAGDLFDVRLAAVPSRILRLLKMIGLDKLFPAFGSTSDAAKAAPANPGGG